MSSLPASSGFTTFEAVSFRLGGMTASPSSRFDADDSRINWVSLSFMGLASWFGQQERCHDPRPAMAKRAGRCENREEGGGVLLLLAEAVDQRCRIKEPVRIGDELLNVERNLHAAIGISRVRASIGGFSDPGRLIETGVDFLQVGLDGGLGDL